jgi:Xaa-Pro aminopeptidase
LLCALENGKQLLIEGVTAQAVHKAVMERISCKGLGHFFPHHAGHRIGQESLMKPDFIEGNTQTLEAGMYVTLEPGIYLPNEFGIRVENNYLITKTGCELLFDYPLNIDYFTLKG